MSKEKGKAQESKQSVLETLEQHEDWPRLYAALEHERKTSGRQPGDLALTEHGKFVQLRCPGRPDSNPSLWVGLSDMDGSLWLSDKAKKLRTTVDILAAIGLAPADIGGGSRRPRKMIRAYNYVSAVSGQVTYRKRRFDPKGFDLQHTLDGGRTWRRGRGPTRLLYRLDLVNEQRRSGGVVWLTEGEKDADTAWREHGVVGTTNDDGATGFSEEDATALINVPEVVVVPDRDAAGAKRLRQVFDLMHKVAPGVLLKLLTVPPPYKDLTELHEAGFTKEEIVGLVSERGIVEADVAEFERLANDKLLALIDTYVYAVQDKRYVEAHTGRILDHEMVGTTHGVDFELTGKNTAHAQFQRTAEARKVATITYMPGHPLLCTDVEGLSAVNIWQPSKLVPRDGPVDWWCQHLERMFPEQAKEREVVYDWCAFMVQRPDVKCNWALFMGSDAQQIGKDSFFVPVIRALGEQNYAVVSPKDVASGKNWYLEHAKLVLISEVESNEKQQVTKVIRSQLTAPPYKLPMDIKYRPNAQVPNIASYVGFSNKRDALWLDKNDQRFFVLWSEAQRADDQYYRDYYKNVERYSGAVYKWLLDRDLSQFNPKAPPMMTQAKQDMIETSTFGVSAVIRELMEEGAAPFNRRLFTPKEVRRALQNAASPPKDIPPLNRMGMRLIELGLHKIKNQVFVYPQVRVGDQEFSYKNQEITGTTSNGRLRDLGLFKKLTLYTTDKSLTNLAEGELREAFLADLAERAGTDTLKGLMKACAKEEPIADDWI